MKFAQQYSRATYSSNLRSDKHHSDVDKLAAVALSSELGTFLFRVKYANDATTYPALLLKWQEIVGKKALRRHWPKHITARKVATASLDYWLNDVCQACSGRCFEPLANTQTVLSDVACRTCQGRGKKPLVCEANWRDFILQLVDELEDLARSAAGAAMRKLAVDMHI